ncbi:hypothetical protein ACJJTC_019292 [Scirpophaga incertulas]
MACIAPAMEDGSEAGGGVAPVQRLTGSDVEARPCGTLKGIIGYSPGHFVAFCRRSNNQWELHNDLSTKEVRITHDPTITPTAAIFIRRDTAVRNQPIKRKRTEE